MEFGEGLLHFFERPADGLGEFAGDLLVDGFGRWGWLGIFEPGEGFGGGGVLAGFGAFGGVGVGERVHCAEYYILGSWL